MYSVFISYSRSTEEFSRKLAEALSDTGYDIWLDVEDIPGGMKWSSAIQQGLDKADIMLVVVSPGAMASLNVEDEWQYFMDKQKPVIPVLYEPADVHFQLNRLQYIDFHSLSFDEALKKLLKEIERKIKDPGASFVTPEGRKAYPTAFSDVTYPGWMRYIQYAWWGVITIFVIGAVLFYSFFYNSSGNNGGANNSIQYDTSLSFDTISEVTAYTNLSSSADSGFISDPIFEQRILVSDTIWYKIDNPDSNTSLYVLDEDLPETTNRDLLKILPLFVNGLLSGNVELFDTPDFESASITLLGTNNTSSIHGYSLDEFGGIWYYIYHVGNRSFAWIPAEGVSYIDYLPVYYKADTSVDVYNRPVVSDTIEQSDVLRIIERIDGWYRVIINHNGEWISAYAEIDATNLPDILTESIPQDE